TVATRWTRPVVDTIFGGSFCCADEFGFCWFCWGWPGGGGGVICCARALVPEIARNRAKAKTVRASFTTAIIRTPLTQRQPQPKPFRLRAPRLADSSEAPAATARETRRAYQ